MLKSMAGVVLVLLGLGVLVPTVAFGLMGLGEDRGLVVRLNLGALVLLFSVGAILLAGGAYLVAKK
jgi:hypothetical protein